MPTFGSQRHSQCRCCNTISRYDSRIGSQSDMKIEFREVVVPDEINALLDFDSRAFAEFPGDLSYAENWAQFKSHWMIVDGEIVGYDQAAATRGKVVFEG